VRRWRARGAVIALMLIVGIAATTVLSGFTLLAAATETSGTHAALTGAPASGVDVTVRITNIGGAASDRLAAIDAAVVSEVGGGARWTRTGWESSSWVTVADDPDTWTYFARVDPGAAELVSGSWPAGSSGGLVEVALPEQAARASGAVVGDELHLDGTDVRVAGIYRADPPADEFWSEESIGARGDVPVFPRPGVAFGPPIHAFGPLLVDSAGLDATGVQVHTLFAVEHPSFPALDGEAFEALRSRSAGAEITVTAAVGRSTGQTFVDTSLDRTLDDIARGVTATRSSALALTLLTLLVAGAACARAARLVAAVRGRDAHLMRARGASVLHLAAQATAEAIVIAGIVVVLGVAGGTALAAVLVRLPALEAAGTVAASVPDASAWLAGGVLAALIAVCVAAPTGGVGRVGGLLRPLGELVLVLVGALALARALTTPMTDSLDPLLAATPALVLASTVVVLTRVVSLIAPLLGTLTSGGRGAARALALWHATRRPFGVGALVLALAIGATATVPSLEAAWRHSVASEASSALGAPVRTDDGSGAAVLRTQTLLSRGAIADQLGDGMSVQVLGEPAGARRSARNGSEAAARVEAAFEPVPESTGVPLPSGWTGLDATVTVTGPGGTDVAITAITEGPDGSLTAVPLGEADAGSGPWRLGADAEGAAPESRLVGLVAGVAPAGDATAQVAIEISDIAPRGASTAGALELRALADWATTTDESRAPKPTLAVTTGSVELGATVTGLGATIAAVGWQPVLQPAVLVPEEVADHVHVDEGSVVSGLVGGIPLDLRVSAIVREVSGWADAETLRALQVGLPTGSRARDTVVVDGTELGRALAQRGVAPLDVEHWATTGAGLSTRELESGIIAAPLGTELLVGFALAALTALVLAVAGFGVDAAMGVGARRLESAQLRALGATRRSVGALTALDAIVTALLGVAIGLTGAAIATALVAPRLPLFANADDARVVPITVSALLLVGIAFVASGVLAAVLVVVSDRSLRPAELLRTGSDG
jgi:hypothetical protein